jgi:hypothetical protein
MARLTEFHRQQSPSVAVLPSSTSSPALPPTLPPAKPHVSPPPSRASPLGFFQTSSSMSWSRASTGQSEGKGWDWAGIGFLGNQTTKFFWGGILLGRVSPMGWAVLLAGKGLTKQGLKVLIDPLTWNMIEHVTATPPLYYWTLMLSLGWPNFPTDGSIDCPWSNPVNLHHIEPSTNFQSLSIPALSPLQFDHGGTPNWTTLA